LGHEILFLAPGSPANVNIPYSLMLQSNTIEPGSRSAMRGPLGLFGV